MASIKRGAFVAGSAAAAVAASGAPARATYGDTPLAGTVTIAVVGPFTGDDTKLGEQLANGARQATDEANQLRGTLDKAFELRTFDDQNLIATGIVNAQFACDDAAVVAVIGHLSGRVTEAAMQTYVNNRMQVICPAASYERLTEHGYGNLLRLATKDSIEGHLAARHINETIKPKSVVLYYQDGDYGPDVAAGFQAQMKGDKVPSTAVSIDFSKPDFATAAKAAVTNKADLVFLAGKTKDMGGIVPALGLAGYTGPYYGSQGFFDPATTATYGTSLEGLTVSSSMPPLQLAPGAFTIRNDFERKYGPMTPLSTFGYAAAQILIAVIQRTNANDRLGVERALNVTSAFNTVIGAIGFGTDGDVIDPNVYFYSIKNGAWRYVTSANPTSYIVK